jgi:hypothetical protein
MKRLYENENSVVSFKKKQMFFIVNEAFRWGNIEYYHQWRHAKHFFDTHNSHAFLAFLAAEEDNINHVIF